MARRAAGTKGQKIIDGKRVERKVINRMHGTYKSKLDGKNYAYDGKRASGRTQSLKLEVIDSLFKPVSDKVDKYIMREALLDFYTSSRKRKPD
ncbi:hypothetical protein J1N35_011293 [Gossypium stocksii]|uniref:Uncharacterized protein n=1 Tax=Gossypium stocksii TaxID=47602 RepID=A0A9D3W3Q6_9ROSI|nr:hypothetical protein J1N35_011293 [Gossypium stocksii]